MSIKKLRTISFIGLLAAIAASEACSNTLLDVKKELSKGGFALWYPAEAGIAAGQIWRMKKEQKDILFLKPDGMLVVGPSAAQFESLKKEVSADASLDLSIGSQLFGNAGPLAAELKMATVKSVSLDFGVTEIERLPLGQFQTPEGLAGFPPSYRDRLERMRNGQDDSVLISAVVTTSGMSYVFECEDTGALKINASKITELIGANLEIKIISKTKAILEIPNSKRMAIGVTFVDGGMLGMSDKEIVAMLKPILMDKKIGPPQFFPKLRAVPRIKKEMKKGSAG
jgi:hypothetical protein